MKRKIIVISIAILAFLLALGITLYNEHRKGATR